MQHCWKGDQCEGLDFNRATIVLEQMWVAKDWSAGQMTLISCSNFVLSCINRHSFSKLRAGSTKTLRTRLRVGVVYPFCQNSLWRADDEKHRATVNFRIIPGLTFLGDDNAKQRTSWWDRFVEVFVIVDWKEVALDVCISQQHVNTRDVMDGL